MARAEPGLDADDMWGGSVLGRIELALDLFRRHLHTKGSLLDVGCGVGRGTEYLADRLRFATVCGVDVSEELTVNAIQRGIDARVVDLDTDPLPYGDASFD